MFGRNEARQGCLAMARGPCEGFGGFTRAGYNPRPIVGAHMGDGDLLSALLWDFGMQAVHTPTICDPAAVAAEALAFLQPW